MPLDPTAIVPSGKYIAILDNTGAPKIMERPAHKSIVYTDGDDFYTADGSEDKPIILPDLVENFTSDTEAANYALVASAAGRLWRLRPGTAEKFILTIQNNVVSWAPIGIVGVPATGSGILIRSPYNSPTPPPAPAFLIDNGIPYINGDGAPTIVLNGQPGQLFTMVNGEPTWSSPVAGSVSAGVASTGLDGVSANNISSSAVSVVVPSLTATKADGTTVRLTNVNITPNLTASVGVGGLDAGAEASNQWYYVYVVSNGTAVGGCISTNSSAPSLTNLGAYVYYALVSVFRNDNAGNIVPFVQRGRALFTRQQVWGNNINVSTSFNAIAGGVLLTTLIPPTTKTVQGMVGGSTDSTGRQITCIASDISGMATQVCSSDDFSSSIEGFLHDCGNFRVPIVDPTSPSLYWRTHGSSGTDSHRRIVITGYTI